MESLLNFKPKGDPITKSEKKILNFVLGKCKCKNDKFNHFIHFLLLPFITVIVYILLYIFTPYLKVYFSKNIYVLIFNTLILFLTVYLLDKWLHNHRQKNILCTPWWKTKNLLN